MILVVSAVISPGSPAGLKSRVGARISTSLQLCKSPLESYIIGGL